MTRIILIIIGFLNFLILNAQYYNEPIFIEKEIFQNRDIFFNRKLLNPALLHDDNKLRFDIGISNEFKGGTIYNDLYFSNEFAVKSANSRFGFTADFINYHSNISNLYFSYRFSYSYDKKISNFSGLRIGLNLGLSQYQVYNQYNSGLGTKTSPFYQLGAIYYSNNHSLGTSVKLNESKVTETNPHFVYIPRTLIINYSYEHNLSEKLSILPEIIGDFSSNRNRGIAAIKLSYSKKILFGLLYSTKNDIGLYFQYYMKNHFSLGYYLDIVSDDYRNKYIYDHSLVFTLTY